MRQEPLAEFGFAAPSEGPLEIGPASVQSVTGPTADVCVRVVPGANLHDTDRDSKPVQASPLVPLS
jgi:hypothetical protein